MMKNKYFWLFLVPSTMIIAYFMLLWLLFINVFGCVYVKVFNKGNTIIDELSLQYGKSEHKNSLGIKEEKLYIFSWQGEKPINISFTSNKKIKKNDFYPYTHATIVIVIDNDDDVITDKPHRFGLIDMCKYSILKIKSDD